MLNKQHILDRFISYVKIDTESEYYQLAYRYIRNITLLDVSELQAKNTFSEADNRTHFILFNSWELFLANTKGAV